MTEDDEDDEEGPEFMSTVKKSARSEYWESSMLRNPEPLERPGYVLEIGIRPIG